MAKRSNVSLVSFEGSAKVAPIITSVIDRLVGGSLNREQVVEELASIQASRERARASK